MTWDFVNFLVPCAGILITFLCFNEDGFISFQQQGRFVLVFILYGWAMLPLMYLLSFLFSIPATGFTRTTMFNIFTGVLCNHQCWNSFLELFCFVFLTTGMATLITVVILQIPELQLVEVADVLDWIFMTLPNYSLGMAFNNLYTNSRAVEYCTRPIVVFACKTGLRPNPCCKSMIQYFLLKISGWQFNMFSTIRRHWQLRLIGLHSVQRGSVRLGRSRHRADDHFPRRRRPPLCRRIDTDRTAPLGEVLRLLLLPLPRID